MRFSVAPLSRSVKVISAAVIFLDAGLIVACFLTEWAFVPAALLMLITLGCYLRAPVAYEFTPTGLTIRFRLGYKRFGHVIRASRVEKAVDRNIRLFGNGGLFAATGIFWNGTWGFFRAYITSTLMENWLIVGAERGKVLISPRDQARFLETCVGDNN